jgi:Ca2+-binding EF-hand superfamily protein
VAELRYVLGDRLVFRQLDKNSDSFVEVDELDRGTLASLSSMAALVPMIERADDVDVAGFDENRDGRFSQKEYRAYLFALSDQSGDGAIDLMEAGHFAAAPPFHSEFVGKGHAVLKKFDRSRDGLLSKTEFKPDPKYFALFDHDRNGKLTADELVFQEESELAPFANQDVGVLMSRFDRNKDGEVSASEYPEGPPAMKRSDRDKNGRLSADEMKQAGSYAQQNQYASLAVSFVKRFDRNGDNKVTRSEFPGPDAAFDRIDRNGNGFVTKSDG